MHRILYGAAAIALVGLVFNTNASRTQQPVESKGWGSLSGKVTLAGTDPVPEMPSLVKKMNEHADKACCLDKEASDREKKDTLWIVDAKTRGVANVVVWVKPVADAPAGTYLPVHPKLKDKKQVVLDQPHCVFIPRIAAYNPKVRDENGKLVDSGRTLVVKNSATVAHNVHVTANPKYNKDFNQILPPKTELAVKFEPQPLAINLQCDLHTWMQARLFAFDHPYYTITNEKGEYELPYVPAGAEISIMAFHEAPGWVLTNKGKTMTLKEGKNTFDFEVKK